MKNKHEVCENHVIMYVKKKGKVYQSLFSINDFMKVADHDGTWGLDSKGYIKRNVKGKVIYLHKLLKPTPKGMVVDHINRNKLDNRQENLRTITKSQNLQNVNGRSNSISGVRGVSIDKRGSSIRWRARLNVDRKEIHLGHYDTKEEAERAAIEGRKKYLPYSVEKDDKVIN
ncbi:HNH endonuclease [Viridibacillus arvi]|uniref:HNH endonuclease n=1 Tax=Viridibacillus arvi TaxID=263475 RepID=UPI0036CC6F58